MCRPGYCLQKRRDDRLAAMLIEVLTFEPATGDVDALVAADAALQEELMLTAPGLVRRTTARGDDGWIVITLWGDASSADAAAPGPAATAFATLARPGSARVTRYETLD